MARAAVKAVAGEVNENGDRMLQILGESARLFATKGYDGTSMRDIAEACGISKSLLYHHFVDKDEIYARIALGSTQRLYEFVVDRLPENGTPPDRVRAFMTATGDYFQRYRSNWIASTAAFWSDPELRRHKERVMWRDRYEGLIRQLIQDAIDAGDFRAVDVPLTGRLVLSALNWMHRWYRPDKDLTPGQIAESYFDLIFNGLKAR
ncbi:TetR/AcrR family transcriptional regulator [Neoroseomonas lacus]|uniref:TetR family transcriptional regulator n=1 Tax=Neoroseomonas lacus TaxID=287609 RepID=A0A917NVT5_9PROT|nr:TetR/AcrR family transcriptional regulator [Neoroseomonas lacus]GGJ33634.1 TetR family transcriptional regulator [Neoroseomonas lacus]